MGLLILQTIKSQLRRGVSKSKIMLRVGERSLKLIALGFLENSSWGRIEWATFRVMGVLQRFAFSYFVCSALILMFVDLEAKSIKLSTRFSRIRSAMKDVTLIWIAWIPVLAMTAVHIMITFLLKVPGCPK